MRRPWDFRRRPGHRSHESERRLSLDPSHRVFQVYDQTTGTFTATRSRLNTGRWLHTTTVLRSGKALIAGGNSDNNFGLSATNTAELYDPRPTVGRRRTTSARAATRRRRCCSMTTRCWSRGMHAAATLNKAELYDPLDSRPLFSTCAG